MGVVLIEAHDPFSATKYRNAHEALGLLFQEEDVEEYIEAFEAISILILDQLEEQSIGWFIRRLKNEIRNWVHTLSPSSCDQAMEYGRNIEATMVSFRQRSGPTQLGSSITKTINWLSNLKYTTPPNSKPTSIYGITNPTLTRPLYKPFASIRTPNTHHLTLQK